MIYVILVIVLFVLELLIKNYIVKTKPLNESVSIIQDKLFIKYIRNKGAIYSSFEEKSKQVCIISAVILLITSISYIGLLCKKGNELLKLGGTLIVAGGASNVYDRIKRKYVVDYIYWKKLKSIIFNLSDVFIFMGTIIVMIHTFLNSDK